MDKNFTNEKLSKKFKSNFELVNYAISLAENMIQSGRDPRVKSHLQNRAMLILDEILEGKDRFDDLSEVDEKELESEAKSYPEPQMLAVSVSEFETVGKKKNRLIDEE